MKTASENVEAEKAIKWWQNHEQRSDPWKKCPSRGIRSFQGMRELWEPKEPNRSGVFQGGRGQSNAPRAQVRPQGGCLLHAATRRQLQASGKQFQESTAGNVILWEWATVSSRIILCDFTAILWPHRSNSWHQECHSLLIGILLSQGQLFHR